LSRQPREGVSPKKRGKRRLYIFTAIHNAARKGRRKFGLEEGKRRDLQGRKKEEKGKKGKERTRLSYS